MGKPKLLVVCGPTATGKTDLAFSLCRAFGGEMLGADSMQVYSGLAIGTATPGAEEHPEVARHLLGVLPPETPFSVADYVARASDIVQDIIRRGHLPVLCGGTGLYIQSLVNGTSFTEEKPDIKRREALEADWQREGAPAMLERLARLDPATAARLHPADKKRILRAIEASEADGSTLAQRNERSRRAAPYNSLLISLDYEDRARLYAAIEQRVDRMLAAGLLAEAQMVWQRRTELKTAAQAIGYKEFFPYFEEGAPLELCVEKLKQATRNYAKRQRTWFYRMPDVHWLYIDRDDVECKAHELASEFRHSKNDIDA